MKRILSVAAFLGGSFFSPDKPEGLNDPLVYEAVDFVIGSYDTPSEECDSVVRLLKKYQGSLRIQGSREPLASLASKYCSRAEEKCHREISMFRHGYETDALSLGRVLQCLDDGRSFLPARA